MIVEKSLPPPPPVVAARVEAPPPYTADTSCDFPSPPPAPESDIHSVNHVHIRNHVENVTGTYCIDTTLPMPHKNKGKSKWQASSKTPNASFRSRHGAVSINLSTKGTPDNNSTKAYVQAGSRKSDISINLYSLQKGKHINLDASSKKGHILVLIPRNFCGAIQLKSRKGGCKVLPVLSSASRLLKAKDREALILIGGPSSLSTSPDTEDDSGTDFCQLESRRGKVIVGFSGEDKYVPPEVGIWQKLGEFMRGGKA